MPNCLTDGRLLRTDEDYERCVCVLAGIDPFSFTDEFRVLFEESGARQCSQTFQLKDPLRSYAAERFRAARSDRTITEAEEARLARQEAVSRQTTTHVVARNSTNEIIEEETKRRARSSFSLNTCRTSSTRMASLASSKLWLKISRNFKLSAAPVLTNALRKKANAHFSRGGQVKSRVMQIDR